MLAPMLADSIDITQINQYVDDPRYVIEQKLDGHRVLAAWDGDNRPVGLTRGGSLYTRGLPKELLDYRLPGYVLDGELIGAPASRKHPTRTNVLWVFDVLAVDGEPVVNLATETRRALLEELAASHYPDLPVRLVPQARSAAEKRALIQTAIQNNLEGVIIKRLGVPYTYGIRSKDWLKAKLTATADVVVIKVGEHGKEAATLGIWNGSDFDEVGRCSLIGKPAVQIGSVVEIKYLYVGANGRLYQPTLMRVRTDKEPVDCNGYEFKHVNKQVLEAL